jgi:hypothetical protein
MNNCPVCDTPWSEHAPACDAVAKPGFNFTRHRIHTSVLIDPRRMRARNGCCDSSNAYLEDIAWSLASIADMLEWFTTATAKVGTTEGTE